MSFCRQEVAVFKNWSVMQNQVEICLGRADLFYVNGLVREMSTPPTLLYDYGTLYIYLTRDCQKSPFHINLRYYSYNCVSISTSQCV